MNFTNLFFWLIFTQCEDVILIDHEDVIFPKQHEDIILTGHHEDVILTEQHEDINYTYRTA